MGRARTLHGADLEGRRLMRLSKLGWALVTSSFGERPLLRVTAGDTSKNHHASLPGVHFATPNPLFLQLFNLSEKRHDLTRLNPKVGGN